MIMNKERDAYVAKMKTKLDKWNAKIDRLEIEVRQARSAEKAESSNQVVSLRAKRTEVKDRIAALLHASDNTWKELRTGVESSWTVLDKAAHSAIANFKGTSTVETR
jgi:uncharacterized protein YdcH (DUF465 family)